MSQALGHYLIQEYQDRELGLPYWDWTDSIEIPDLFDGIDFPDHVDRMAEYPNPRGFLGRSGTSQLRNPPTLADNWRVEWTGPGNRSPTSVQFVNCTDIFKQLLTHKICSYRSVSAQGLS